MSSSQAFPSLVSAIDTESLCGPVTSSMTSTEWYAPSTYTYHDPYATPYPTTTMESQAWAPFVRSSLPDIHMPAYGLAQQQPQPQHQQESPHMSAQQLQRLQPASVSIVKDSGRPKSSPGRFPAEPIAWSSTGLGIQYTTAGPTPVTSTFPPNLFQTLPTEEHYETSSPPEIRQPQPRRAPYASIAPNPAGIAAKRRHEDDEQAESSALAASKRRKRTSSVASADLSEDDRFLVRLKEDENLPWKDIVTRFQADKGKSFQVAALQMRYKRLREKFRIWEDNDIQALRAAHEYWEKNKWEIISARMLEHGVQERWPARHCARKWQEIMGPPPPLPSTSGLTPGTLSQFSTPNEGPMTFAFMPIP